jgi:hypothetical protein
MSPRGKRRVAKMVDPERLELPTPAFEAQCSIQLSYGSPPTSLRQIATALVGRHAHYGF